MRTPAPVRARCCRNGARRRACGGLALLLALVGAAQGAAGGAPASSGPILAPFLWDSRGGAVMMQLAQAQSRPVVTAVPRASAPATMTEIPLPATRAPGGASPGIIRKPTAEEVPREPAPATKVTPPPTPPPLKDLGEATKGKMKSLRRIGVDEGGVVPDGRGGYVLRDTREPVAAPDLDHLPYSAVGQLETVHESGARYTGTGFLIGPRLVLTAAHVLHYPGESPALRVTFTPGCARGAKTNAQPVTVDRSRYLVSPQWDVRTAPLDADYGLVALPPAVWAAACGSIRLRPVEGTFLDRHVKLRTDRFMLAGFPIDKPSGTEWVGRGRLHSYARQALNHQIDTNPGQSGAPVIAIMTDEKTGKNVAVAIAIHSRDGAALAGNFNQSRVLDQRTIRELQRMAQALGESF